MEVLLPGDIGLRALIPVITLIMVIALIPPVIAGTPGVTVFFDKEYVSVRVGDDIRVKLIVDPDGYSIQSGEIIIAYNGTGLKVKKVELGDLWGDKPLVAKNKVNETHIFIAAARIGEPIAKTSVALEIVLQGKLEGFYTITLKKIAFADENGNDIPNINVEIGRCHIIVFPTPTTTTTTVTITIPTTITQIITKTATTTITATTAVTKKETYTATTTLYKTKTITLEKTITMPTVYTTTILEKTLTTTITKQVTDYTTTIIACITTLIIGLAVGLIAKRK
ncbi:MAG: hypothetical protein DRO40_09270 [Thermoprotei archaeon]|nr:MAG: hypothetical protein DRO40_09270 [Thermoprotei archaeon]